MPTNYAITSSNGGTWSIQNTDTAVVGRYHDLSWLMEGAASPNAFTTSRPGVFASSAAAGTAVPTGYNCVASGSGLVINIAHGAAVVERSALVGPYAVQSRSTASVTLDPADTTNPRIDRIDLQVFDGALGDNGGTSLTQIVVTTGTPAGSPTVPAAPAGSIPLAQVLLPANTTTVTSAMITDTRRSTALRGSTRYLLPGDSLADPGYMPGEMRDTSAVATQGTLDRWNPVTSAWETLELLGVGAGYASYVSTDTATTWALSGGAANLLFQTAQNTCPDVTPSGTGNWTFTFNRPGTWGLKAGMRVSYGTAATSGDFFFRFQNPVGNVDYRGLTDNAYGPIVIVRSISLDRHFNAGDKVTVRLTNNTDHTMTAAASGELMAFSALWLHA